MLATIERIERKQGQNGSYHLVHLGEGKRLYCWDSRLAQSLQVGSVYELEVREGRFPRLTGGQAGDRPERGPGRSPGRG